MKKIAPPEPYVAQRSFATRRRKHRWRNSDLYETDDRSTYCAQYRVDRIVHSIVGMNSFRPDFFPLKPEQAQAGVDKCFMRS